MMRNAAKIMQKLNATSISTQNMILTDIDKDERVPSTKPKEQGRNGSLDV